MKKIEVIEKLTGRVRYYVDEAGNAYDPAGWPLDTEGLLRLYSPSVRLVLIDGEPAYYEDMHGDVWTLKGEEMSRMDAYKLSHGLDEVTCPKCEEVIYYRDPDTNKCFDTDGKPLRWEPDMESVQTISNDLLIEDCICTGCYESLTEYGCTLVVRCGDAGARYVFDDGYLVDMPMRGEDDYELDYLGGYDKEIIAIVRSAKWHSVGWRGYYEFNVDEKVVKAFNGGSLLWGHHSQEMEEAKLKAYRRAMGALDIPMFEVYSHTGNVFAMNADYFTRAEDAQRAENVTKFVHDWYNTEDWRWNIGVIFSNLQGSQPTKDVVEDMKANGDIPDDADWQSIASGNYAEA